ncbi:MAG: tetratricopeptide repeat protein [Saprospiraceae bacterium]|nr:tetratricopeptide repeat protein [Saprospiraceae bacterium]
MATKNNKLEWLNAAAELYLRAREYRKAIDAFATLRDKKEYPTARLNYALALKQNGQFDEAIPEFLLFLNNYEGKDRPKMLDKIEDHIAGCTLAIKQSEAGKDEKYAIEHMSANINSTENDFAPVPFGDDILYFTSSPNGQERILRSQQLSVDWSLAATVENLPIPMGASFGNGAFSPDGNRFYFAQWSKSKKKKEKKPSCSIFVIQRVGSDWSAPKALPEGVNTEGGISTTPFILSKGEKDLLFFASNKTGGRGGLDIWYTIVNPKTNQCDDAQNIGGLINTEGDEMTPFYDVEEKTLFFASNGRPTFGGYDIFKATGSEQTWTTPENMGTPFNTGADDYYFVKNKSRTGGFFASNRALGMEKISSRDDDVYFFDLMKVKIWLLRVKF